MSSMTFGISKITLFVIIPLVLSIGVTPALLFADIIPEADALKAEGKPTMRYGSTTAGIVCGDRLCSEIEQTKQETPVPEIEDEKIKSTAKGIDFERELALLPEHFGGVGPMTVTPFIGEVTKQYPEFYVPGTEELDENEMRIFACGTGSPWNVPAQKGSCFLIQTGADHNLIFDIGGGSIANLNSLGLTANELNHIFVSHLHVDHVGDLDMFWGQGFMWGRSTPLTLHGPSSSVPELGTASFAENFLATWAWDLESKRGLTHSAWHKINVNEFDYSKTQVVYEEEGMTVTSFPALHAIDGAVSYRMEWNGMSVVYSGDTTLNSFIVENSKDADVILLQIFPSAKDMAEVYNTTVEIAQQLIDHAHISPQGAGALLQITQPRVPILFHLNLFDTKTVPNALAEIREYYDKPIVVAQDRTVVNVTPDYAVARQAQLHPALASSSPTADPDEEQIYHMSEWLAEAWYDLEGFKKQYEVENMK